jgi:hypothetical protein
MGFGKAMLEVLSEKLVLCMNLVKFTLVFTILLWLQAVCLSQDRDRSFDGFVSALATLKNVAMKEKLSEDEIAAAKLTAKASRPEDSWPAILQLWLVDQRDSVEALWWQKDDGETRAFIVALYWCSHPPPREETQQWPASVLDFDSRARRFASPEKEHRVDENRFIKRHLSAVAKELTSVLITSSSPRAIQLGKKYAIVANSREGEPLR